MEMSDEDTELLSVYYGNDVTAENAEKMQKILEEEFPDYEMEFHAGGQPVYYYIISVE